MKSILTALFVLILIFSNQLFAQPGNLDNTFNGNGKVITSLGNHNDVAFSVAVQSDGKIVAGGSSNNGTDFDFSLTRYNVDGSLDASFGTNGIVTTPIGTFHDQAFQVILQPNGKIILAGRSYMGLTNGNDFALVRYNSNGTLDSNFGINGVFTTAIGTGDNDGFGAALQPDGKIIEIGNALMTPPQGYGTDFALMRCDSTGAPDLSFGTNGIVTTDFNSTDETAHDIKLYQDGKIIVAGWISISGLVEYALARYNANGTLDTSFNHSGKVTTALNNNAYIYSIALAQDGKILAAGYSGDLPNGDFSLVRYNADGSLDASFGNAGIAYADGAGSDDEAYSVAVQTDGKIVMGGYSSNAGLTERYFTIMRFNNNGTLDNTFGADGKALTNFGGLDDACRSVCLQPDGKIIGVGYSNNGNDDDVAVARYLISSPLGIVDLSSKENSVFISPNPVQSTEQLEYTLTGNETVSVAMYDVCGKLMQSFITNETRSAGTHNEELKLKESLPAGNYILTLISSSLNVSVKMVKH